MWFSDFLLGLSICHTPPLTCPMTIVRRWPQESGRKREQKVLILETLAEVEVHPSDSQNGADRTPAWGGKPAS